MTNPRGGDATSAHLVPVAAQSTFREIWIPAAVTLGLQWVPMFEAGFPVDRSDLPDVIRELETLRDFCLSSASLRESILARLERLIDELNKINSSDEDVEIFIG
ncbi:hypothetical protein [Sorangium cellulosum]|uniref:hypothetical protein n=1 Tax=Sorangium cellulosum TaxID=56 RepID=UPI001F3E719A|nr:hypothetical protein [Sorangium cellulosum]